MSTGADRSERGLVDTQIIAFSILMVVYLLVLLPLFYCFWRLYRYRTKLQTAQRMLKKNVGAERGLNGRAS